jgi:hypothetical protein
MNPSQRAEQRFLCEIGGAFVLVWIGILGYQSLSWLQTAHWPEFVIWDGLRWVGLRTAESGWAGFDKILWWFLTLPLSLVPLLLGGFFLFGAWGVNAKERENERWIDQLRRLR